MNSLVLAEKLASALGRAYKADAMLEKAYGKIESILQSYAVGKKIKYEELRVLHISDERGEIQPDLLRFVESAPPLPGQTEKRYRRYISEKESGIRRIIRALTGIKPSRAKVSDRSDSILLKAIPNHIKPLLEKLPRVRGEMGGSRNKRNPVATLTENGQLLLLAVCRIDSKRDAAETPPTIGDLLRNHLKDVRNELRSLTQSPRKFLACNQSLRKVLRKLNLSIDTRIKFAVHIKDWPQPFRSQYDQYVLLATGETLPSAALLESAAKHNFSLKTHKAATISALTLSISQALAVVPHDGTLSVADLIRLQPTEVVTEDGCSVELRNPIIDHVRETERAKATQRKRANYDSQLTRSFLFIVKAIAARTGFGHLIEAFNQVYKIRLDVESIEARKKNKKKGIPRQWIDAELERVGAEFDVIVKGGLFKRAPGRSKRDADRAMRLCLFYVQFLTMRLIGYRQQAIRGCILGKNITFLQSGTVIWHYDEHEVKNGRTLEFKIEPTEDGTHERLRRVLITYNKKVLPYIRRQQNTNLGDHFFAQFDRHTGQFRGFNGFSDYSSFFRFRVAEFFNLHELSPDVRYALNPHFLRGVCADWMIYDLHMTFAEAARVLGDTEAVVRKHYADRNAVCDATPAFDKVNAARRAARNGGDVVKAGVGGKQRGIGVEELLKGKDRQIDTLTDALDMMKRQFTSEIAALKAELAQAKAANSMTAVTA